MTNPFKYLEYLFYKYYLTTLIFILALLKRHIPKLLSDRFKTSTQDTMITIKEDKEKRY